MTEMLSHSIYMMVGFSLEEVVSHYNDGGHYSSTVDPLMKKMSWSTANESRIKWFNCVPKNTFWWRLYCQRLKKS